MTDRDEDPEPLELLQTMVLIRTFEDRVAELFADNELPGFVHLYQGQEAVATGACATLAEDDYITSTHRGHGHSIAKGLDPSRMMAELFGAEDGYCGGKSGSMHIADLDEGMLGANGIVGAGTAIATGAGLSIQQSDENRVCICFFGEGAMSQGVTHESMNMAAVQSLPVVFVCENNLYGEMTPAEEQHEIDTLADRGSAYGMPGKRIDGMDVLSVYESVEAAVERAEAGDGPSLVVCDTYRYRGHYEGDPVGYRSEEEVDSWRERDPIESFASEGVERGDFGESDVEAVWNEAEDRIDEAEVFARESDAPAPETAFEGVYTEEL